MLHAPVQHVVEVVLPGRYIIQQAVFGKRFHGGERGVFARYILQLQERQTSTVIKDKFETDSSFREQALRYMDQFEQLLAQARIVDRADVMGATFVTADVGKLYLVLANALGRTLQ